MALVQEWSGAGDVRYRSQADILALGCDVRFTPKSGHPPARDGGLSGVVTMPITLWIDLLHLTLR
jgi:hypothetical protein